MRQPLIHGLALLWTIVVGAIAVIAPRPLTDNAVTALLDSDAPKVREYRQFLTRFGSDDVIVARISGGRAFERYRLAATVTATLAAAPSMRGVLSVSTVHPETTTVILDEVFGGPAELTDRAAELESPIVRALDLWSSNAANVYGLAEVSAPSLRAELASRLVELRGRAERLGLEMHYTGPPLLNLALDQAGRRTESTALPLLLLVSVVLLLVTTGSVRATVALCVPVGLGVLATDGAFGAVGGVTNILVNIAKPLLFVIGLASAVHVYFEARNLAMQGVATPAVPWLAARRKAVAVTLALATTSVGFGSLALSDIAPIRAFGQVAGFGLLLMIPTVLLTLPLGLALLARPRAPTTGRPAPWSERAEQEVSRVASILVASTLARPWVGPALGLAVIGFGLSALPRLTPEPHAIRYFPPEHPLRRDQAVLEDAGMGVATVEALISGPRLTTTATAVASLLAFSDASATDPSVAAVVGWPHIVAEATHQSGRPHADAELLRTIAGRRQTDVFARANGMGPGRDEVRVTFMVRTVDARALARLNAHLRTVAAETLDPQWHLTVTGSYQLLMQAQAALLDTIQVSLFWTAVLMELALLIVLRSFWLGLVALVPNLFPVALNLAAMAVLGVPLDLGTSMTAAIALGIAVDDTLHFTLAAARAPMHAATRSAGAAIVMSSVVIGLGFAALLSADFLPTRRFGGLCALAMFSALVADLIVLPPLIQWAKGGRATD